MLFITITTGSSYTPIYLFEMFPNRLVVNVDILSQQKHCSLLMRKN